MDFCSSLNLDSTNLPSSFLGKENVATSARWLSSWVNLAGSLLRSVFACSIWAVISSRRAVITLFPTASSRVFLMGVEISSTPTRRNWKYFFCFSRVSAKPTETNRWERRRTLSRRFLVRCFIARVQPKTLRRVLSPEATIVPKLYEEVAGGSSKIIESSGLPRGRSYGDKE